MDQEIVVGRAPNMTFSKVPFSLKAGWGIGAAGTVTMMIVVNVMLLFFMTNELGISPGVAGLLLGAVKLIDMFVDPLIGALSDRTRSRWGRRRPWMFVGALLSAPALVALFWAPAFDSEPLVLAYMAVMLLIFYGAYSIFTVPYIAMPAEMTDSYTERTSIMSFRTAASGIAGFIGVGLAPFLIRYFGGGQDAFTKMACVVAVLIFTPMLASVLLTARSPQLPNTAVTPVIQNLEVLRNRDFTFLLCGKFFAILAVTSNASVGLLFQASITLRGPGGLALFGTVQHLMTIASVPLWLWWGRYFEKSTLFIWSLVFYGGGSVTWFMSGPAEPDALFILRGIVIGIGYAGIVLMTLSMLPDATQNEFQRTGKLREGAMAGLFSAVEKTAFAVAPIITGLLLSAMGYIGTRNPAAAPTAEALLGIKLAAAALPVICVIVAIPFAAAYRISRRSLAS